MLKRVLKTTRRAPFVKYTNDLVFALILFLASFIAITTIIRSQERSLLSELTLKSSLIKDAVINQSKINFLLSDSIGFSNQYDDIFILSDEIIKASFFDSSKNLIWGVDQDGTPKVAADARVIPTLK